jgi:hypothetical protein
MKCICINVAVIESQYKYALIKCGIAIVATFSHYYLVITNVVTFSYYCRIYH